MYNVDKILYKMFYNIFRIVKNNFFGRLFCSSLNIKWRQFSWHRYFGSTLNNMAGLVYIKYMYSYIII